MNKPHEYSTSRRLEEECAHHSGRDDLAKSEESALKYRLIRMIEGPYVEETPLEHILELVSQRIKKMHKTILALTVERDNWKSANEMLIKNVTDGELNKIIAGQQREIEEQRQIINVSQVAFDGLMQDSRDKQKKIEELNRINIEKQKIIDELRILPVSVQVGHGTYSPQRPMDIQHYFLGVGKNPVTVRYAITGEMEVTECPYGHSYQMGQINAREYERVKELKRRDYEQR